MKYGKSVNVAHKTVSNALKYFIIFVNFAHCISKANKLGN